MTRAELIERFKLWHVYYDVDPDTILCEGSKTACLRYLSEHHLTRKVKRGEIRLGQIIWEATCGDLLDTLAR
jgi:hypothetical protein